MNPAYDECPKICVAYPGRKESGFCANCDAGIAKIEFEEASEELLKQRLGNTWNRYDLFKLIDSVASIFEIKERKDIDITVTAQALVNIVSYEQYRQKRIEAWNEKQKRLRENANR